jgi:hypothetical protein
VAAKPKTGATAGGWEKTKVVDKTAIENNKCFFDVTKFVNGKWSCFMCLF